MKKHDRSIYSSVAVRDAQPGVSRIGDGAAGCGGSIPGAARPRAQTFHDPPCPSSPFARNTPRPTAS